MNLKKQFLSSVPNGGCTGFMASKGDEVWVGSNIDVVVVDPRLEIYKPDKEKEAHGRIIFQYWYNCIDCKSTGLNDQGLWYDWYEHQLWPQLKTIGKKSYKNPLQLEAHCLATCSTVEEVIEEIKKYNRVHMSKYNAFFVDKTGNWVIVEGNKLYKNDIYNKHGIK